jgi:hypothetical protein
VNFASIKPVMASLTFMNFNGIKNVVLGASAPATVSYSSSPVIRGDVGGIFATQKFKMVFLHNNDENREL